MKLLWRLKKILVFESTAQYIAPIIIWNSLLLSAALPLPLVSTVDWMFVSTQNSHVEASIPRVVVFGGEALGGNKAHEGGALMNQISGQKEETGEKKCSRSLSATWENSKRTVCKLGGRASLGSWMASALILNSRTAKYTCLLSKLPSEWCSVTVAGTKTAPLFTLFIAPVLTRVLCHSYMLSHKHQLQAVILMTALWAHWRRSCGACWTEFCQFLFL